jgi:hypothetical protein
MKKNIFVFSVFILFVNNMPYAAGQRLREEHQLIIKPFVDAFKNNDKNAAARLIRYPLEQTYPLRPIENESEMLLRFDEIFDRELIDRIKNSSLENDWSSAGWRGITLGSGTVWIDYDGKMITTNYTTRAQLDMRERALQRDREKLYVSLRNYNRPVGLYSSDTYKIRIDQVKNNTFRLVLWRRDQKQSEKPKIIIEDGIRDIQGSMGNTYYLFNDHKNYYIRVCT